MKTRLYLDTRRLNADGKAPLRIGISRNGQTAFIPLDLYLRPEWWNAQERRLVQLPATRFPNRTQIDNYISRKRAQIESVLLRLEAEGELHLLSALQVRDRVLQELNPQEQQKAYLLDTFRRLIDSKTKDSTKEKYEGTYAKVMRFTEGKDIELDAVTPQWVQAFSAWLPITGVHHPNTINLHLRFLRSVFNFALDNGLTAQTPFRTIKVRFVETDKRSLTLEQLRSLSLMPLEGREAEYRDIFMLSFYLIGINIIDLLSLTADNIQDGRIRYRRAKTGKRYDIRILPQAQAIIDRYAGTNHVLYVLDRYKNVKDYTKWCNTALHELFPNLTTYWARHTWATLAYNELGISTDIISLALGHSSGHKTTAVYINPDLAKVDEANRRMLELIFG